MYIIKSEPSALYTQFNVYVQSDSGQVCQTCMVQSQHEIKKKNNFYYRRTSVERQQQSQPFKQKQLEVDLQITGVVRKNNSSNTRAISKRYTSQNHFQRVFMIFQGTLKTVYY